jgi:LmbE family N-acetylglucosaminyl deacetylase
LLDIVKKVESLIEGIAPHTVFTHCARDLNIDHAITHRTVLTATRPVKGSPVREVYTFEVLSSTEWAFGEFGSFKPNLFIDVTETIEMKSAALSIYDSEMRGFPHPRSAEAMRILARRWGSVVGLEFAEAFETVRRII